MILSGQNHNLPKAGQNPFQDLVVLVASGSSPLGVFWSMIARLRPTAAIRADLNGVFLKNFFGRLYPILTSRNLM